MWLACSRLALVSCSSEVAEAAVGASERLSGGVFLRERVHLLHQVAQARAHRLAADARRQRALEQVVARASARRRRRPAAAAGGAAAAAARRRGRRRVGAPPPTTPRAAVTHVRPQMGSATAIGRVPGQPGALAAEPRGAVRRSRWRDTCLCGHTGAKSPVRSTVQCVRWASTLNPQDLEARIDGRVCSRLLSAARAESSCSPRRKFWRTRSSDAVSCSSKSRAASEARRRRRRHRWHAGAVALAAAVAAAVG